MLKIFEKTRNFKELRCFKSFALRSLSTEIEQSKKANDTLGHKKKFTKPLSVKELKKDFNNNFINDFFRGKFDKSVFEYPAVLEDEEIDSLVKHSVEVENYVSKSTNLNCGVTRDTLKDLQKLELLGLSVPQNYGGLGYTQTETKFLIECIAMNSKISRFLCQNEDLVMKTLSLFGTEEQKEIYLSKLIAGDILVSFAYLEDAPLIDLESYTTTAIFDAERNGFLINGSKKWVLNAHISDFIIIFVRSTKFKERIEQNLTALIVDRCSPGLTIHELKSKCAKELGLYEIDFQKVFVPKENLIGEEENGYDILKTCLSYHEFGSAATCSSIIKRLNHSAIQFCREKLISDQLKNYYDHLEGSVAMLTTYAYALESVLYMVSGRFDTYENPNMFLESILTKIFAVDMLQHSIQKYIQIVGFESYKYPDLLDEALEVMKYYSIFGENNAYLKLIIGADGIIHSTFSLSKEVKKLRKPDENPGTFLAWLLTSQEKKLAKIKSSLQLKNEVNITLSAPADLLELSLGRLKLVVEKLLIDRGSTALQEESKIIQIAEMAIYIYGLAACIARASNSYCNYNNKSENEVIIANVFGDFAHSQVELIYDRVLKIYHSSDLYKSVGKETFNNKDYPVQHPLTRSY